jgi:imidazolonepropionase-like amidohydrolase
MRSWLLLLMACQATAAEPVLLRNARLPGTTTPVNLHLVDGRIAAVGPDLVEGVRTVDLSGSWVAPAFIDSHVHLTFLPVAGQLRDGGIVAAVDLASPISSLDDRTPLTVLRSGPMVTAPKGYPTQSWGRLGYGLEVADADAAEAGVTELADAGATLVKVPLGDAPELSDATLSAAVGTAHARGLRVVAHALEADAVTRAADVGIDALAHTPVEPLSAELAARWSGRAVISTLDAFGARDSTLDNLRRLRDAGAVVLYGTDLGNTRTAAIQPREIAAMQAAGLTGEEILAAGTVAPATWWGLTDLGSLDVGKQASLLVLDADPHIDPTTLARPQAVWMAGEPR